METTAKLTGVTTVQLMLPHMRGNILDFLDISKGTMNDFTIHCRIGLLVNCSWLLYTINFIWFLAGCIHVFGERSTPTYEIWSVWRRWAADIRGTCQHFGRRPRHCAGSSWIREGSRAVAYAVENSSGQWVYLILFCNNYLTKIFRCYSRVEGRQGIPRTNVYVFVQDADVGCTRTSGHCFWVLA